MPRPRPSGCGSPATPRPCSPSICCRSAPPPPLSGPPPGQCGWGARRLLRRTPRGTQGPRDAVAQSPHAEGQRVVHRGAQTSHFRRGVSAWGCPGSDPEPPPPPAPAPPPGRSLTGKKRCSVRQFSIKKPAGTPCVGGGWLAVGGWRLAVGGGWWWLAAVGGWGLVVDGGWQWLAVGGWSLLAVGSGWRLALGGWRLVVPWGSP